MLEKKGSKITKILLVSTLLRGKGGMETVVRTFVSELEKRGVHVKLVLLGKYKPNKHDLSWLQGLDYELLLPNFPLKGFIRDFLEVKKLTTLIKNDKPDAFIGLNNSAILHLWKVRNRTYPFKIYSWVHFALKILHNTSVLKKADYHLSISSGITHELIHQLGIEENKVFTVYNPVNSMAERESNIIERPCDGSTSFLFVGRLTEQKNPALLIRAVSRLRGDWKLHIIGEGNLKCTLEQLTSSLHLEERVIFHGWKADVWNFIRSVTPISALILTSRNEGFPMVLLEALSRGVFCISSNCETGPSDIVNNNNGQLFEEGNEDELSKKLQHLIDSKGVNLPPQRVIQSSIEKFSSGKYCERIMEALEKGNACQRDNL